MFIGFRHKEQSLFQFLHCIKSLGFSLKQALGGNGSGVVAGSVSAVTEVFEKSGVDCGYFPSGTK